MNNTQHHQQLVHEILLAIGSLPHIRVWKMVNGMALPWREGFEQLRPIHFGGPNGSADISGIRMVKFDVGGSFDVEEIMVGQRLEIEVKTGSAKQTKEQLVYQKMIEKFGGLYILAKSVDDALRPIQNALL